MFKSWLQNVQILGAKIRKVFETEKKVAGNLWGFLPKWGIMDARLIRGTARRRPC